MKLKSLLALGLFMTGVSLTNVNAQVDNDISLNTILSPNINGNICNGYQELIVKVANLGSNQVSAFGVGWSLDGILQSTSNHNVLLTTFNTSNSVVNLNLGLFQLTYNVPSTIKVWTYAPNGQSDAVQTNDTFTVVVTPNDVGITLNPLNDTTICYNGTLSVDAGFNPYTDYTWSNGTQAQLNTITQPGTHWVWAYSNQGCMAFDTFQVTEIREPMIGNLAISDVGNRIVNFSLSNPVSVTNATWDFGDGSPIETGVGSKSHQYATDGMYTVVVTIENACGSNTIVQEIFISNVTSINTPEDLVKAINIYPNPANDVINIMYPTNILNIKSVHITNTVGQTVKYEEGEISTVQLSNLPTGLYQMLIETSKGRLTKKIEIRK